MAALPLDVLKLIINNLRKFKDVSALTRSCRAVRGYNDPLLVHFAANVYVNKNAKIDPAVVKPDSARALKVVFVKMHCRGINLNAHSAILHVLTRGGSNTIPKCAPATRYAIHLLCEKLGLAHKSGEVVKAKFYGSNGCSCCNNSRDSILYKDIVVSQ